MPDIIDTSRIISPSDDAQAQALVLKASRQLAQAQGYVIDSPELFDAAADDLKQVKSQLKTLEEKRKAMTVPLDNAKKAIMDFFRAPTNYLEQAEQLIKGSMLTYQQAEEAKRRAEQARLDELARQEKERILAEAEATPEAQIEAAAIASIIMAPTVAPTTKVAGIATVERWKARVMDKYDLIRFVAANPQYGELLTVNETALNAQARSLKGNLQIPGVQAYPEQTISARAA